MDVPVRLRAGNGLWGHRCDDAAIGFWIASA